MKPYKLFIKFAYDKQTEQFLHAGYWHTEEDAHAPDERVKEGMEVKVFDFSSYAKIEDKYKEMESWIVDMGVPNEHVKKVRQNLALSILQTMERLLKK